MSEPWTTKQRAWLKTCYPEGRKVSEFESEFEAVFGLKRTRASFYQCLQKIKQEENLPVVKIRREWVLPEITKVVELYGVMSVPGNWFNKGGKERQKNRSKTFPGIAKSMAMQWGGEVE